MKQKNDFKTSILKSVSLFIFLSSITLSSKEQTTYQAENYTAQSGVTTASNHAGFTGSGFVDYGGNGTWAEWNNVSASAAGTATISFRYANRDNSQRNCLLTVNGVSAGTVAMPGTGSWSVWNTTAIISINLNSGNNTIRLTANTNIGGPNLDNFDVTLSTAPPACGSSSSGPVNNPVETLYGSGYPWAADIKWNCVFNISDYGGNGNGVADNTVAFNNARDAATANGGGVVYFPPGVYYFSGDISLKNGVVIRGATPSVTDAKSSSFAPASKLVFPKYNASQSGNGTANSTAFKNIRTTNPDTDSNIGLVYLEVNRAGIILTGNYTTGTNKNILVLGVRSNNVADPDAGVPLATYNNAPFQNAWQRWSYRFVANIKLQAFENILVANNRVNDNVTDNFQQNGFIVRDGNNLLTLTGEKAIFNYSDHYGIYVNRGQGGNLNTPVTGPSLFRNGVVVRDNWVYATMRVKIHAAGQGLIIKDNVLRDQPGKIAWVNPTGTTLVGNAATLENRGIDWGGHNVLVTGNDVQVVRHNLKNGNYFSVDGEGILIQECCGGTTVRGVTITNNTTNTYIGLYKMKDIEDASITYNTINNAGGFGIFASANANVGAFYAKNVKIENNSLSGSNINLLASGAGGGTGNTIINNSSSTSGNIINYTCIANPTVSGNSGFTINTCTGPTSLMSMRIADEKFISAGQTVNNALSDIKVYPLPANNLIYIDVPVSKPEKYTIELLDLRGKLVLTLQRILESGVRHLQMPVSGMASGTYILRIRSESMNTTKKVIIVH